MKISQKLEAEINDVVSQMQELRNKLDVLKIEYRDALQEEIENERENVIGKYFKCNTHIIGLNPDSKDTVYIKALRKSVDTDNRFVHCLVIDSTFPSISYRDLGLYFDRAIDELVEITSESFEYETRIIMERIKDDR